MASQRTGQSLRRVARALAKAPDEAVREAADRTANEARARGGSFFHGKTRLGAKIKRTGDGEATVLGTPAGAWAIKSYGRSESRARPGSVLGVQGGKFHSATARPTRGDKRWDKVRDEAEDAAPRATTDAVSKAMRV